MDADGSVHKGWAKSTDGTYYYMDLSTGYMVTGWKQINNNWYYFRSNGAMATKWVEDGGKYYYLSLIHIYFDHFSKNLASRINIKCP